MGNNTILFNNQDTLVLQDRGFSQVTAVEIHNLDSQAHPYLRGQLADKVSKAGDNMTGNLVMGEGAQITMSDGAITSKDGMIGLEGNEYWLRVDTTSGLGAAINTVNGVGNVLTSFDVKSTYNSAGNDPVNGQAVAQAISGKQNTITGAASTVTNNNLSANRAVISSGNGKITVSNVTSTELGYVSGATSSLQTQINNEKVTRKNTDESLQSQIDAISAGSDVTDVVGTYAELQSYDTSKLSDNDIIKVLSDSTHNDASAYYRWNTSTFVYIGAEGPYYTKSEADAEFLSQSGAATTYLTQANAASTYATQTALSTGLASKASNADGTTIVDNGATISTVAVKEQRANVAIKEWVGTKAQYDTITTKDANTKYFTKDEDDSAFLSVDSALSPTSENPVQNKVIYTALAGKQSIIKSSSGGTGFTFEASDAEVTLTDTIRNQNRIYAYITNNGWSYASDSYSIRIPCLPFHEYVFYIDTQDTSVVGTLFRVAYTTSNAIPSSGSPVTLYNIVRTFTASTNQIIVYTGADAKYLVLQVTNGADLSHFHCERVEQIAFGVNGVNSFAIDGNGYFRRLQSLASSDDSSEVATTEFVKTNVSTKQDLLTRATGYDATKTQILKNVQGTLTWVDEA